jgi:hypothetical protein
MRLDGQLMRKVVMRSGGLALLMAASPLSAQVQVRLGTETRATYSDIHEQLRPGTPAADSVRRMYRERRPERLWRLARRMLEGQVDWNTGVFALTRLAELRWRPSHDSVLAWRRQIIEGELPPPPATDLSDLFPPLRAIDLELQRGERGDAWLLNDILARIPEAHYDQGDAWVLGRLPGAGDSLAARFLATEDRELRVRYLTLMSYSTDTTLIPLLARIHAAPDSFSLPLRAGARASDGLAWIGTRGSMQALLDARAAARARGTYADPKLGHADLDFLGNDSSVVEWVRVLK